MPVLAMQDVSKAYGALRPLRIAMLTIHEAERVAIGGLDAGAAELLVNLITGASLPDAGAIRVFGRRTSEIADGEEWLASLERFGIVSPRAVLLDASTLLQNLAMPFTLEIDPVTAEVTARVRDLAARCGIDEARWLTVPAGELPADVRVRAHLARALALGPRFLIVEHPTAEVPPAARHALAADLVRASAEAGATLLILTNDDEFGSAVAPRHLRLDGATGLLKAIRRGWFTW